MILIEELKHSMAEITLSVRNDLLFVMPVEVAKSVKMNVRYDSLCNMEV